MSSDIEKLTQDLKHYSYIKSQLKNDCPSKYYAFNTDIFINLSFWIFLFWQIWTIVAILFPSNNTLLVSETNATVVFKSTFCYVFESNINGTKTLSSVRWFSDAYIFLFLTIFLLVLLTYTFIVIKNWIYDMSGIFAKNIVVELQKKIKKFNLLICFLMLFALINLSWTCLSLLYVPDVDKTNFSVGTFLFSKSSRPIDSWITPLTKIGLFTLLCNIFLCYGVVYLYCRYCYEKFINNNYFFKETRSFVPIKEKKQSKKFNKNSIKPDRKLFEKANYIFKNTEGYFAELENINKIYHVNNQPFYALNNINLKIQHGEFIVILGPSGSGKTTLLNILSAIDIPTNGSIRLLDHNTKKMNDAELSVWRRKNIGYIFQNYALLPNLTVRENVEIVSGLNVKKEKIMDVYKKFKKELLLNNSINEHFLIVWKTFKNLFKNNDAKEDVNSLLKILNLYMHADKLPHQLSGGQQQRTAIARALIKRPKILFCDEATGALDHITAKTILELFFLINKYAKTTVILITHNPTIATVANRILYVSGGQIVRDVVNKNPTKIEDLTNL